MKKIHFPFRLFLFIWAILLLLINSYDLKDFTLQQAGIEAIVERRNIYLEGSYSSLLQPNGDVFKYQDHLYAVKQPGQVFLGAFIYYPLSKLGIKYTNNYLLAAGIVTALSATLPAALTAILLYQLIFYFTQKKKVAALAALALALATEILPYSGIAHHDIIATFLSFFCFYCLIRYFHWPQPWPPLWVCLAGIAAGSTFFFSFLSTSIIILAFIYLCFSKNIKVIGFFALLAFLATIPALMFNFFVFGGVTNFPNIVGQAVDTLPQFSLINFGRKLIAYLFWPGLSITFFTPITLLGFIGYFFWPKKYRKEKILFPLSFLFLLLHLGTMDTVGHYQYGPRYLLPIMPFGILGLAGYWQKKASGQIKKYLKALIKPAAIYSFLILLLGSLLGVMYPSLQKYPLADYIGRIQKGWPQYPMANWGIIILLGLLISSSTSTLSTKLRCRKKP